MLLSKGLNYKFKFIFYCIDTSPLRPAFIFLNFINKTLPLNLLCHILVNSLTFSVITKIMSNCIELAIDMIKYSKQKSTA